jgi:hypothetical protein
MFPFMGLKGCAGEYTYMQEYAETGICETPALRAGAGTPLFRRAESGPAADVIISEILGKDNSYF